MSMRLLLAIVLLLIALSTRSPLAAQETEIAPGRRVLVTLTPQREVEGFTPPQMLRGTLLEMTADSMTLQLHPGTSPIRVSRDAIRRVYLSRGVPSRAASAAAGAVAGAAGGALYLWLFHRDEDFSSDAKAAWTGAAIGGAAGLVGGALFPRERWRRVRLPARPTVAPAAGGDGTAVGFGVAF
jgi:hypothetical protein